MRNRTVACSSGVFAKLATNNSTILTIQTYSNLFNCLIDYFNLEREGKCVKKAI